MGLNVIGLVSGGKDGFFGLVHCQAQGHRVVALANLYPAGADGDEDDEEEEDLNSFMYQTVGHRVLPRYGEATGLPLYRQAIEGGQVETGREYGPVAGAGDEADETESMTALLRRVMAAHPEAEAVAAGALLSTYQRTRVESVAGRLGLVSLAYLWQWTVLPGPGYLEALAAAGFDARIVKVASGGLDASLLWTDVASAGGRARVARALAMAGGVDGDGSLLGEGGEYETLVVDGPASLFRRGSLAVAPEDRTVVSESGGSAWLRIRRATVIPREAAEKREDGPVMVPDLLDACFAAVVNGKTTSEPTQETTLETAQPDTETGGAPFLDTWSILPDRPGLAVGDAMQSIAAQVRARLGDDRPTARVVRTLVLLRHMDDFAAANAAYAALFRGAPNPPARVTIACGARMPADVAIAVHLSVRPKSRSKKGSREGLHVQSRSYWAPANIGPYSQAISVPAVDDDGNDRNRPRVVAVAGQIPLVPATMELPVAQSLRFQAALALQHLWRIGVAMGVQWWSSAVAYVSEEGVTEAELAAQAVLAAEVWRAAHEWSEDDDDNDDEEKEHDGPDLWDRKFDARYAAWTAEQRGPSLPDWTVLGGQRCLPPAFLAAVGELPRGAPVEWQVHAALSRASPGSLKAGWTHTENGGVRTYRTVLQTGWTETVRMWPWGGRVPPSAFEGSPDVVYVDMSACEAAVSGPLVPCASLWDGRGGRLAAVTVRTSS